MAKEMKITTKEYKTKNAITCTYKRDDFPTITTETVEELLQTLAPLAGSRIVITFGVDDDGDGFGVHVRLV